MSGVNTTNTEWLFGAFDYCEVTVGCMYSDVKGIGSENIKAMYKFSGFF